MQPLTIQCNHHVLSHNKNNTKTDIESNQILKENKRKTYIISHHILQTGNIPQKSLNHQSITNNNHHHHHTASTFYYILKTTHTCNKHDTFPFCRRKHDHCLCHIHYIVIIIIITIIITLNKCYVLLFIYIVLLRVLIALHSQTNGN